MQQKWLWGKFIITNAYIKTHARVQINNLTLQLNELEEVNKLKPAE